MAIDFKAFRALSYGLCMVTSRDGERLNGQIANSVIQVTSSPPQIAAVLNKGNLTHEFVEKAVTSTILPKGTLITVCHLVLPLKSYQRTGCAPCAGLIKTYSISK